MTLTIPITLLVVALIFVIAHVCTGGRVPLWPAVLLDILSHLSR